MKLMCFTICDKEHPEFEHPLIIRESDFISLEVKWDHVLEIQYGVLRTEFGFYSVWESDIQYHREI